MQGCSGWWEKYEREISDCVAVSRVIDECGWVVMIVRFHVSLSAGGQSCGCVGLRAGERSSKAAVSVSANHMQGTVRDIWMCHWVMCHWWMRMGRVGGGDSVIACVIECKWAVLRVRGHLAHVSYRRVFIQCQYTSWKPPKKKSTFLPMRFFTKPTVQTRDCA